jgi:hypothetical protein
MRTIDLVIDTVLVEGPTLGFRTFLRDIRILAWVIRCWSTAGLPRAGLAVWNLLAVAAVAEAISAAFTFLNAEIVGPAKTLVTAGSGIRRAVEGPFLGIGAAAAFFGELLVGRKCALDSGSGESALFGCVRYLRCLFHSTHLLRSSGPWRHISFAEWNRHVISTSYGPKKHICFTGA